MLVLNTGSSTLKYSLFESDGERLLGDGIADWSRQPARLTIHHPGLPDSSTELTLSHHGDAVGRVLAELIRGQSPLLRSLSEIAAVGHRVVHGGSRYTESVRVTPEVKTAIGELSELAPLHNSANLDGINAAEAALPGVPQVVAFDTAFHATIPPEAHVYPLPYAWYSEWGLRRYGFHGLSHAYCTARATELLGKTTAGRLVICHLGNGCSVSAVHDGRCLDTSMGFTPLEGLMMGTRSGSVDPGLLLYVIRRRGQSADDLDRVLNKESGLLGVSGLSSDMRQVLAAVRDGNERARLALDVYAHRVRQTIGAMTATLGGIDALVFTAGIGENAAEVRARICTGLGGLGLALDAAANGRSRPDADVAAADSRGRILIIATREDLMIVRQAVRLLGPSARAGRGDLAS
ncbi:MAG TPA: acetate kinase [Gemmataceae bacterium]|nr:acetate kinase [Gemmataceae bacterium]